MRFPSLPIHIQSRILDGTIKQWWRWRGIIIGQLPESGTFTELIGFCFPQRFFQECTTPFLLDWARAFSLGKIKIHFLLCYTSSTGLMLALLDYHPSPELAQTRGHEHVQVLMNCQSVQPSQHSLLQFPRTHPIWTNGWLLCRVLICEQKAKRDPPLKKTEPAGINTLNWKYRRSLGEVQHRKCNTWMA